MKCLAYSHKLGYSFKVAIIDFQQQIIKEFIKYDINFIPIYKTHLFIDTSYPVIIKEHEACEWCGNPLCANEWRYIEGEAICSDCVDDHYAANEYEDQLMNDIYGES